MQVRATKNQPRLGISEWQGDLVAGREYEVVPTSLVEGKITQAEQTTELPPLPAHVAQYLLDRGLVESTGGGLTDELAALAAKDKEIAELRKEAAAIKAKENEIERLRAELDAVRSVSSPQPKETNGEAQRTTLQSSQG